MSEPISHEIDELAIRTYRLKRTQEQLAKHNIAAAFLNDPVNNRYL